MSVDPQPARPATAGMPGRSAAEIRRDIDIQRRQLGTSVEALRGRVTELTDWRRQVREHKRELVIGAAVVGFAIGGLMALRRR
jgi:orotate phosphoribosyltransferase-like protein